MHAMCDYKPDKAYGRKDKLAAMVEFLTESHLDSAGGYPYDCDLGTFPGYVIVAELDHDGATEVGVYKEDDLLCWYDDAADFMEEEPDYDWVEALNEVGWPR